MNSPNVISKILWLWKFFATQMALKIFDLFMNKSRKLLSMSTDQYNNAFSRKKYTTLFSTTGLIQPKHSLMQLIADPYL